MAHSKTVYLLINTASRSGRQAFPLISRALTNHGFTIDKTYRLTKRDDLAAICRGIRRASPELLIIAGGDGTVSQTVHHFADSQIELGIIPLGTTNNFARSLNIPLTIDASIEALAQAKTKSVDLGIMDGRYFANVVGVGLSASIAKTVTNVRKRRFGRLAYAFTGFSQLMIKPPFVVTVTDTQKALALTLETRQLIVANGRYHAGKIIAQDAHVNSNELVIFALGGSSRFSFARHMFDFYFGPRKRIIHGSYLIGTDFIVEASSKQSVEVDGEPAGRTPVHIKVAPEAIKVRCLL